MGKTGIVKDERYINHRPGVGHPESHRRLEVVYAMLEESDMTGQFQMVPVRRAEIDELTLIHSADYVNIVASTAGQEYCRLDPDTATSPGSYEAALLAAGGLCQAISMVLSGELDNAFALVRPPGHHAEMNRGMGFCLFNNVAVGARYAQKFHNLKRVIIVDWDLHHGNGTQHSFEKDPSILYFSTHQYPYYPGTGANNEVGIAEGEGYTVNVPLSMGYGDAEYLGIFDKILKPIAMEFNPDLVLVSAGFDIYLDDPLGGMNVTPKGFAGLTRSIMDIAKECCGGKAVFTLEGGYDLTGLRHSIKAVLKELKGLTETHHEDISARANQGALEHAVNRVIKVHSKYWKNLLV